jgi:DNA N-6-adenine-methyltransferase Dam
MTQTVLINVPPHNGNEDENQRFTTDEADAWLRRVAGVTAWDLDAAACHESHRASRYFTSGGLELAWDAPRVFCNPPWDNIEPWVFKAWREVGPHADVVGMLLPLRTHRPWWQVLVEPFRDGRRRQGDDVGLEVHHPPTRFAYGAPGNVRAIGVGEPNFQTVGLVFRRQP